MAVMEFPGGPSNRGLRVFKGSKQAETFSLCAITLDCRGTHEGTGEYELKNLLR